MRAKALDFKCWIKWVRFLRIFFVPNTCQLAAPFPFLNWWTRYRSIRTINTAIPFFWFQSNAAFSAIIKELTRIDRHCFFFLENTFRAFDDRFSYHSISLLSKLAVIASPKGEAISNVDEIATSLPACRQAGAPPLDMPFPYLKQALSSTFPTLIWTHVLIFILLY